MSSVGSSNDSIRRNRDEYLQKESDLVKRQQKELKRMAETHDVELNQVQSHNEQKVEGVKKNAREVISSRDLKYQKEMDDLRSLHRRQLSQVSSDSDREISERTNEMKGSLQKEATRNEAKLNAKDEHFHNVIEDKDKAFQKNLESLREEQKETISHSRNNSDTAHQKQVDLILEDKAKSESNLQKQLKTSRDFSERQISDLEQKGFSDTERLSKAHMSAIQKERSEMNDNLQHVKSSYDTSLNKTRERYDAALKDQAEDGHQGSQKFKTDIEGRINSQLNNLHTKVKEEQDLRARDQVNSNRSKSTEVKNVRDEFQKNIDDLEKQKQQLLDQSNQVVKTKVDSLQRQHNTALSQSNKFFKERLNSQDLKNRESLSNFQTDFSARNSEVSSQADQRVKRVLEHANSSSVRLQNSQRDALDTVQAQHAEDLKDLRDMGIKEKSQAVEGLKNQMREREAKHSEQLSQLKMKFEKQVNDLNDQLLHEHKGNEDNVKRLVTELKKGHQSEIENLNLQNQQKIRQLDEQHNLELKNLNRRNEEKMNDLVTTVSKNESHRKT